MANIAIDILQLYGEYFGYIGLPYIPNQNKPPIYTVEGFQDVTILESENYTNKKDVLGRPLFDVIMLNDIDLGIARLTLSMQKKIVKTAVTGRAGTVKELISAQDFKISIKGLFYNLESNDYPTSKVEQLKTIFEEEKSIKINSRLTDIFEITRVVVESISLEEQKQQNIQAYSISLISDDDFTAILNE